MTSLSPRLLLSIARLALCGAPASAAVPPIVIRPGAGNRTDATRWSFGVIEHLFDASKQQTGNAHSMYRICGRSDVELGVPFTSTLRAAPGARHSDATMAPHGAAALAKP